MKTKRKNALFSFHPAMVPQRTRVAAKRRTHRATSRVAPSMGKPLSRTEQIKEAELLRAIAKLGRRNPVAKKKRARKKRQPAALAKYWAKQRRKKNTRRKVRTVKRRRPVARRKPVLAKARPVRRRVRLNPRRRTLRLGLTLNTKQKRRLASFLRAATGKRVKVQ